MVVGEAWHAECRSCDVSRTCAANVMLCRPSQDVSHCSHKLCYNSGVRVHACNVTSPITALKSSGADKCAKVLRRDQKQLVVKEPGKSLMQPPRHCQAHTGHSRHAAKYVRRQRLAVCARHTKNARTTRRAKSSSQNHKCVAGRLHLTIWWWAWLSSAFQLACAGFCSAVGALICSKLRTGHRK